MRKKTWTRLKVLNFLCKGYFLNEHQLPGKMQTDTGVSLTFSFKQGSEKSLFYLNNLKTVCVRAMTQCSVQMQESKQVCCRVLKITHISEQANTLKSAAPFSISLAVAILCLHCLTSKLGRFQSTSFIKPHDIQENWPRKS